MVSTESQYFSTSSKGTFKSDSRANIADRDSCNTTEIATNSANVYQEGNVQQTSQAHWWAALGAAGEIRILQQQLAGLARRHLFARPPVCEEEEVEPAAKAAALCGARGPSQV